MQGQGLKVYNVYINDESGLILSYFTARSNLIVNIFVYIKGKRIGLSFSLKYFAEGGKVKKGFIYMKLSTTIGYVSLSRSWSCTCMKT